MPDNNSNDLFSVTIEITILFLVLVSFILGFVLWYQKRKQLHNKKLSEINSKAIEMEIKYQQELLTTQLEIQEQTLNTISQEIHDNIGQVLSLAKLNLSTFPEIADERGANKLKNTKELIAKAIRDLRDLTRSMHGDRLAELGLIDATANELKILQNSGQYTTQLKIIGQSFKLDPQKETVVFRIVQEALHNCVKHAQCQHIKVSMHYNNSGFILTISDDGKGFDMIALNASQKGIGLKSMQNRAALINADFEVNSTINNGTTITLKLINRP